MFLIVNSVSHIQRPFIPNPRQSGGEEGQINQRIAVCVVELDAVGPDFSWQNILELKNVESHTFVAI